MTDERLEEVRQRISILVPDVHAIGMIAVVRSLATAGYNVWAGSSRVGALGLQTAVTTNKVILPAYDDDNFNRWLRKFVETNKIDYIVPSEGFLLAILPHASEFHRYLPLAPGVEILYPALSKARVIENLESMNDTDVVQSLPETVICSGSKDVPDSSQIEQLDLPIYVKTDELDAKITGSSVVYAAPTYADAESKVSQLSKTYHRVLLQSYVHGVGVGVYFLLDGGKVIAEFMNRCVHEVPHTGGFCSLRETWHHQEMRDDALEKAQALCWQGVIMVEYRWDAQSGEFHFVEINARFWAALHLALYSGVDFPRILLDRAANVKSSDFPPAPKFNRCRIAFPYEFGYVLSVIRDRNLRLLRRLWAPVEYLLLFVTPGVRDDLWYPGDRRLFFFAALRMFSDIVSSTAGKVLQKLRLRPVNEKHGP